MNLKESDKKTPRFLLLSRLVQFLLILPHGSWDVERIFSHMNIVKNKLRTSLNNENLSSILAIRDEKNRKRRCIKNELDEDVSVFTPTKEMLLELNKINKTNNILNKYLLLVFRYVYFVL